MDEIGAYGGYAQTGSGVPAKKAGALEMLDVEIEHLEKALMELQERLRPVLNQYARGEKLAGEPMPEPESALRGRAMRVAGLREQVVRLFGDLDL